MLSQGTQPFSCKPLGREVTLGKPHGLSCSQGPLMGSFCHSSHRSPTLWDFLAFSKPVGQKQSHLPEDGQQQFLEANGQSGDHDGGWCWSPSRIGGPRYCQNSPGPQLWSQEPCVPTLCPLPSALQAHFLFIHLCPRGRGAVLGE